MSGDREARALAAGDLFEVGGKKYRLRPVVAQHLKDLERDALQFYKRQYLQTFTQNADLLGNGQAKQLIADKFDQVAQWTLDDLPKRDAFDASGIPVTKEVKKWVHQNYDDKPDTDDGYRALVSNGLDDKKLTPAQVKELSGKRPVHGRVRFDQWWVTASISGMVSFITSSIRTEHPEVTEDDVARWPFPKIAEAARRVEHLTTASLGNM